MLMKSRVIPFLIPEDHIHLGIKHICPKKRMDFVLFYELVIEVLARLLV